MIFLQFILIFLQIVIIFLRFIVIFLQVMIIFLQFIVIFLQVMIIFLQFIVIFLQVMIIFLQFMIIFIHTLKLFMQIMMIFQHVMMIFLHCWLSQSLKNCHFPQWLSLTHVCPSDAMCHHRTWSKLVKVIACCLMASSHYLNQCCLKNQWGLVTFTWR